MFRPFLPLHSHKSLLAGKEPSSQAALFLILFYRVQSACSLEKKLTDKSGRTRFSMLKRRAWFWQARRSLLFGLILSPVGIPEKRSADSDQVGFPFPKERFSLGRRRDAARQHYRD